MNYTLMVFEEVPENIFLYLIPNDEIEKNGWLPLLQQANNNLINSNPYNEGLSFVNAACTAEKYIDDDTFFFDGDAKTGQGNLMKKEWRCVLVKYKLPANSVIENTNITRVIVTGFVM